MFQSSLSGGLISELSKTRSTGAVLYVCEGRYWQVMAGAAVGYAAATFSRRPRASAPVMMSSYDESPQVVSSISGKEGVSMVRPMNIGRFIIGFVGAFYCVIQA